MNEIVRKNFRCIVKADGMDEEGKPKKTVVFIASTDAVDRYNDVVDQTWELDNYNSNPVVQVDHDYSTAATVGRGRAYLADDGTGRAVLHLAIEQWGTSARAQQTRADVEAGILSALSVGFRPRRSVARNTLQPEDPRYSPDSYCYVHYNNELLEGSIVAIPANPEALAQRSALPSLDLAALERQLSERVTALVLARVAASLPDPTPAPAPAPADPWFD
jgi:hypothetical protein